MLITKVKKDGSVKLSNGVTIKVIETGRHSVRLGLELPPNITVEFVKPPQSVDAEVKTA